MSHEHRSIKEIVSASFYGVVRWFGARLVELFYREIKHSGEELPLHRPLLLAANHPNSVMDPIVLVTSMKRPVAFLARAGLFRFAPVGWLLRRFHAIPVMRRQDGGDMSANKGMFAAAHDQLVHGGVVGIFPHGHNVEERRIEEIKSGAARIALGAEAEHDWNLGVLVVPVGLNYEDRDRFTSRLLVRWGDPIDVSDYRSIHARDAHEAVAKLTSDLLDGMRHAAVHLDAAVERRALDLVTKVYAHHLQMDLFGEDGSLEDRFFIERRVGDAIAWFLDHDREAADHLLMRIDRHLNLMRRIHLRERVFRDGEGAPELRRQVLRSTLQMLLGLPFAIWGLLHNWLPYQLTAWFTRFAAEEAIVAVTAFLSGICFFSLWYALLAVGLYGATESILWTALYGLSIPGSGFFAAAYLHWLRGTHHEVLAGLIVRRHPTLLAKLKSDRTTLIAELDTMRERFVAESGSELSEHLATRSSSP